MVDHLELELDGTGPPTFQRIYAYSEKIHHIYANSERIQILQSCYFSGTRIQGTQRAARIDEGHLHRGYPNGHNVSKRVRTNKKMNKSAPSRATQTDNLSRCDPFVSHIWSMFGSAWTHRTRPRASTQPVACWSSPLFLPFPVRGSALPGRACSRWPAGASPSSSPSRAQRRPSRAACQGARPPRIWLEQKDLTGD
jgi:hypothetical protein